ncbi:hypothetical protein BKA67DRAFT_659975 [Truncatella angustata]|uniref:DUF6594 domain-containing protein n=1 Tax=Truncatella angustata TaxID=152316 RepID=A0A9P8UJJ7_9PEZI|nr:uncharacterized protein BKA67DRAFT_659975 [Truncatella angustata]KAH6653351.1 hypothetical protein BKA67DRAFT_659975 [Truncatella angustata]KAH8196398.1 hypothetical protein TruAng_009448 [Truncatella angustata]
MPSYVRDSERTTDPAIYEADGGSQDNVYADTSGNTFPVQGPSPTPSELEIESRGRKKTHQRSITAVRVVDMIDPEGSDPQMDEAVKGACLDQLAEHQTEEQQSGLMTTKELSMLALVNESGSSSESSSTVIASPRGRRTSRARRDRKTQVSPTLRINAMNFLDSDSPVVTDESIRNSFQGSSAFPALHTSPSSKSTSSSYSGSLCSNGSSENTDHDTDWGTSPEQSPAKKGTGIRPIPLDGRHKSYGTPEMPRGSANLPHISPEALTSHPAGRAQVHHVKHLPRAERLPLTGYEQLASQLAGQASNRAGPCLRPMYRRFETLNHRLLLHLQDELCELEEQLHRLDTADTQTRRLQNCILPASRRAEALSGGELQWHKTDILGKIGFKLEQYNRVLSSLKSTESFTRPTMADVHEYRGYLATHSPIAEPETRFLDTSEDLICLGDQSESDGDDEDAAATPMPRKYSILFAPKTPADSAEADYLGTDFQEDNVIARPSIPINLAMVVAVVVPTLTFSVIPDYIGRMAVVLLVGTGVLGALVQSQAVGTHATTDFCICAGAYGAIMSLIAGVYR